MKTTCGDWFPDMGKTAGGHPRGALKRAGVVVKMCANIDEGTHGTYCGVVAVVVFTLMETVAVETCCGKQADGGRLMSRAVW